MPILVEYQVRRSEVWALYWWMWRRSLWRSHLAAFVSLGLATSLLLYRGNPTGVSGWVVVAAAALFLPVLWIIYPQLRFKPQRRTLVIDTSGIKTKIGSRRGTIAWSKIGVVHQMRGAVVIQRKRGNAFIVPARAFASPAEAEAFYREAEQAIRPHSA
jgi:hypothetical protein